VGPGTAFAYGQTQTTVGLGLLGTFTNIGSQNYQVSGGQLQFLVLGGVPVTLTSSRLSYSIQATVNSVPAQSSGQVAYGYHVGPRNHRNPVQGEAQFSLTARTPSGTVRAKGQANLNSTIPVLGLPLSCDQVYFSNCTSEIPGLFVGTGQLSITQGGQTSQEQVTMVFESPYLNPFGGPLTIASVDGAVAFAATYTNAISQWSNVQVGAVIANLTSGATLGALSQTSSLTENLLRGTEVDQGTSTLLLNNFTGSLSNLNGQYTGRFNGNSSIPVPSSPVDCSAPPLLPGTCTETGSMSTGTFSHLRSDQHISITGTYAVTWSVPAYYFTGLVEATFKTSQSH